VIGFFGGMLSFVDSLRQFSAAHRQIKKSKIDRERKQL
jgi:hypothetical protein